MDTEKNYSIVQTLALIGWNSVLYGVLVGTIEGVLLPESQQSRLIILLYSILLYSVVIFIWGLFSWVLAKFWALNIYRVHVSMVGGLLFIIIVGFWGNVNMLGQKAALSSLLFDAAVIACGYFISRWIYSHWPVLEKTERWKTRRWWVPPVATVLVAAIVIIGMSIPNKNVRSAKYRMPPLGKLNKENPNILLVTIDTLRADHLSIYGYPNETSPFLTKLALQGTIFDSAYSQANITQPSHASILTGQQPYKHGLSMRTLSQSDNWEHLKQETHTLAEILRVAGYETAGFVSAYAVHSYYGFNKGFRVFDDDFEQMSNKMGTWERVKKSEALNFLVINHTITRIFNDVTGLIEPRYESVAVTPQRTAEETNEKIFQWAETRPQRPFFLWVHYYDPHGYYHPPDLTNERFYNEFGAPPSVTVVGLNKIFMHHLAGYNLPPELMELVTKLYDEEILYVDRQFKNLWKKLEEKGLTDNLLTIVTSDHGEALGQHNESCHGFGLYEEQLHVPLIIYYPLKVPGGGRISQQVRTIDIVPTILDMLDMKIPYVIDGVSLFPLMNSDKKYSLNLNSYAHTYYPMKIGLPPAFSIWDNRFRYIWHPDYFDELYDTENDPHELVNMAKIDIERAEKMKKLLFKLNSNLHTLPGNWYKLYESEIPEQVKENLKALGYLK